MTNDFSRHQMLLKLIIAGDLSGQTALDLSVIVHFCEEQTIHGKMLVQIVGELSRVEPKNYARVRDYFFELNDNAERLSLQRPREYAKKLRNENDISN